MIGGQKGARRPLRHIILPRTILQPIIDLKNLPLHHPLLPFPLPALPHLQSLVLASNFVVLDLGLFDEAADDGLLEAIINHCLQVVEEIEGGDSHLFEGVEGCQGVVYRAILIVLNELLIVILKTVIDFRELLPSDVYLLIYRRFLNFLKLLFGY